MPNRIIKESICRSEEINALSWFEEVLFYRLIVNCDDFGRFDGRIKIIKNMLFPLKCLRESDIESAVNKLTAVGLASVYYAQGKPVLQLTTWDKHQRIRAKVSKYPEPDGSMPSIDSKLLTNDSKPLSNVSVIQSNPIQSESKYESYFSSEQILSSEQSKAVFTLPLNTDVEYPITVAQVESWEKLYPAVDIMQQLRAMKGWLDSNPKKRKTKNGILRFVNGWLAREQDKGGKRQNGENSSNPFLDYLREEEQNDNYRNG